VPTDRFHAELKGMDSVDLPGIDDAPPDPTNCRVETTIRVGPAADDSGDDFTLIFITPSWLAHNIPHDDFCLLEYTVVLSEFTWPLAERAANALVEKVDAGSWGEFVAAFSRIAFWEYSGDPPPAVSSSRADRLRER
jgi:Immunity protein 8